MKFPNKSIPVKRLRRGAAVVEFAVCLPVILLIVFGSIEAASMLFLRQALIQSSYEAAKVAVKHTGTNSAATIAAQQVAAGRRINSLTITFQPADVSRAAKGDFIRVTVAAPGNPNSLIPFGPFKDRIVSAQAVMVKE